MTILSEPNRLGDVLKWEADARYSRDAITIVAGAGLLKVGAVLGQVTAGGKFKAAVSGAADGTQVAAGVLVQTIDATGGADVEAVAIRRHAIVSKAGLQFDASYDTQAKRDAALVQLDARGVVARDAA